MSNKYRWGIISTGNIANHFVEALKTLENAEVLAVGSRSQETANNFSEKWSIPGAYASYEELYKDPDVDIVYVGTPHNIHHWNVIDALNAGKHVLCEKSFAINATQSREMVALAREKKLFLMEAMWNRFQPWYSVAREIIDSGQLGEPQTLKADLSFKMEFDPEHRLFNPHLAGGALLDLGVYPIALSFLFFGKPESIESSMHLCETVVDDQVSMNFSYNNGASAELGCSSRFTSNTNPRLIGSKGYLEINGIIPRPEKLSLHINGQEPQIIQTPYAGNAYQYEAQAVMNMLDKARIEHPLMPLDETIQIIEVMDKIRSDGGLIYPGESR